MAPDRAMFHFFSSISFFPALQIMMVLFFDALITCSTDHNGAVPMPMFDVMQKHFSSLKKFSNSVFSKESTFENCNTSLQPHDIFTL